MPMNLSVGLHNPLVFFSGVCAIVEISYWLLATGMPVGAQLIKTQVDSHILLRCPFYAVYSLHCEKRNIIINILAIFIIIAICNCLCACVRMRACIYLFLSVCYKEKSLRPIKHGYKHIQSVSLSVSVVCSVLLRSVHHAVFTQFLHLYFFVLS